MQREEFIIANHLCHPLSLSFAYAVYCRSANYYYCRIPRQVYVVKYNIPTYHKQQLFSRSPCSSSTPHRRHLKSAAIPARLHISHNFINIYKTIYRPCTSPFCIQQYWMYQVVEVVQNKWSDTFHNLCSSHILIKQSYKISGGIENLNCRKWISHRNSSPSRRPLPVFQ